MGLKIYVGLHLASPFSVPTPIISYACNTHRHSFDCDWTIKTIGGGCRQALSFSRGVRIMKYIFLKYPVHDVYNNTYITLIISIEVERV